MGIIKNTLHGGLGGSGERHKNISHNEKKYITPYQIKWTTTIFLTSDHLKANSVAKTFRFAFKDHVFRNSIIHQILERRGFLRKK